MTLKNNRAPLLCCFKLYASFHNNQWIQTKVTVRKRSIRVKIGDFLSRMTLKIDEWPWKTTGHLFYATSSLSKSLSDVIMTDMTSQITSLMVVYSSVYSGANQRKHQSSASLAFVRGIHRWPVHKGPVTRKMSPFDDVIMYPWAKLNIPRFVGFYQNEYEHRGSFP